MQDGRHTPDIAFDERGTDRLVIRRFQAQDASTLSTYRSDPTVARYQSWDSPFTLAQAQAFIDSFGATNPDTPGEWFQFALVEAATGTHIGDVAAGVDADDPRLVTIGVTLATFAQGNGYASAPWERIEQAFGARPTGVGRAITTYNIPIEGRDEWLAAARWLA